MSWNIIKRCVSILFLIQVDQWRFTLILNIDQVNFLWPSKRLIIPEYLETLYPYDIKFAICSGAFFFWWKMAIFWPENGIDHFCHFFMTGQVNNTIKLYYIIFTGVAFWPFRSILRMSCFPQPQHSFVFAWQLRFWFCSNF